MLVIAHRGACTEAPENSLEAFEKAIDAGAERIELDLHLSKDGLPFVSHDASLKRLTGRDHLIAELSSSEIKELNLSNGERIPSLDIVLDSFLSRVELNLELKEDGDELARRCLEMIAKRKCSDKIIMSSFYPDPLKFLANAAPALKRAGLWADYTIELSPHLKDVSAFMLASRAQILHPDANIVDKAMVDLASKQGWSIFPYIALQEEEKQKEKLWEKLLQLGVSGLCTNYTRELTQWLKSQEE